MTDAGTTGTPGTGGNAAGDAAKPPAAPLDDVMLAMDVVDTLRHRRALVERELQRPESDEALLERLRRIYDAQGIEVPDRILREGVEALREGRFAYEPPADPPLWARFYVQRGLWLRRVLMLVVAALLALGAYRLVVIEPREALAADIEASHAAITELAPDDAVQARADALHAEAAEAAAVGDVGAAHEALDELEALQARLESSFELRIASGPDAAIGVWRVPDVNQAARNYYLIVEAVGEDGEPVTLQVRNEETEETSRVSTFGLGVTQDVWDRIAADLDDDGILQDDRVGVKEPGELEPEYSVETTGGAITRW